MIKAVIFDIGGVIVPNLGRQLYVETSKAFNLDQALVKKVFKSLEYKISSNQITLGKLWILMADGLGVDADNLERLWRHVAYRKVVPSPKMVEIVDDLKKRGYTVAVLSNTSNLFADIHYIKGHYKNFHSLFLSHELGMAKPDLQIYKYAIEKLGVKPEECVFIDDHKENLVPARQLGMHTILFQSITQFRKELEKLL